MSDEQEELEVTRGTIIGRGLFCGCPNCGEHGLLKNWFKLNKTCSACGLNLEKSDGFYSGTTSIGYVGAIIIVLIPILVLVAQKVLTVAMGITIALLGCGLFIVLLYPLMLGWMVMAYYFTMPKELPENGGKNTVEKHL
jgi:uncharacterized protein (DUF983 family)